MVRQTIAVIGCGSWGTAVALHLASNGHHVLLWGRNSQHIQQMKTQQANPFYLPNFKFPQLLTPTDDINVCANADLVMIATPSHAFTQVLAQIPMLNKASGICWITKGIEKAHNRLLSDVIEEKYGKNFPFAVISGPSFASEVAKGLPTAIVVAGNNEPYLKQIQSLLHHRYLRAYISHDAVGVQLCGTVKNVLAIACGISDGMEFGANARAALITRGLAEMKRLGIAMGAQPETFAGLAGIGDLVLTCTDNQSRNRRFGLMIGEGKSIADAEKSISQVIEGKHNAAQLYAIAQQYQVQMPISKTVYQLLQGQLTPQQALAYLMERPPQDED